MTQKFIIDCDAGVDDAMALLMAIDAHKRKEIEILAITAVNGNTKVDNVLTNILRTLDAGGCPDIPVHRGSESALVLAPKDAEGYHGIDGFNDVHFDTTPDETRVQEEGAVLAICRHIHENPGEVTLVALGPLTNVALAFKLCPDITSQIKEIFIMGGNCEGVGNVSMSAEFNFYVDPEAAFVVLNMNKCPTYIATWELCYKYCKVDMDWRLNCLGKIDTPQAKMMNALEKVWYDNYTFHPDHFIMCDQLAMAAALDVRVMTKTKRHWATIELSGLHTKGLMVMEQRHAICNGPQFNSNVTIIERVDETVLKNLLLRAFGQTNGTE